MPGPTLRSTSKCTQDLSLAKDVIALSWLPSFLLGNVSLAYYEAIPGGSAWQWDECLVHVRPGVVFPTQRRKEREEGEGREEEL